MTTNRRIPEESGLYSPASRLWVSAEGLTLQEKGVTLWVQRGGQGAKRTEAARKIGQIEIPLLVAFEEEG